VDLTATMFLSVDGVYQGRGPDTRLELESSRTTPSGTHISTYRPGGRAEYGEATVE
jgi:hypothetical protein